MALAAVTPPVVPPGEFVNNNTLTVYIKRLREKIEPEPSAPQIILTVRGTGYRLGGGHGSK